MEGEDRGREAVRVGDGIHRRKGLTLSRREVANRQRSAWQIVEIGDHLRGRVDLLEHAMPVDVDGPDAQRQTDFSIGGCECQALLTRHFASRKAGDICEDARARLELELPEVCDRWWDRTARGDVVRIGHVKECAVGIEHHLQGRIFGRGPSQGHRTRRRVVQSAEHDRLIGEQQPLDMHEVVGAVAGGHAVDNRRHALGIGRDGIVGSVALELGRVEVDEARSRGERSA